MSRVTTGVDIRPYADADEHAVIELLNVTLGAGPAGTRPASFFRWKHLENPFGRSFMLVAETDGRIVGLRAFMRWEFEAQGPALPRGSRGRHGDAPRIPGARDLLETHAGRARRPPARGRLHLQHAEREEPARVPEDGMAGRRPRADPGPGAAPDPVRDGSTFVAHGERARHRADRRRGACCGRARADGATVSRLRGIGARGITTPRDPAYLRWRYGAAPLLDYRAVASGAARRRRADWRSSACVHAGRWSRRPSPRRWCARGIGGRRGGCFDGWRPRRRSTTSRAASHPRLRRTRPPVAGGSCAFREG